MIVGGLRSRLLHDSFFALVQEGLAFTGWLDPGRQHRPIQIIEEPPHWSIPVAPNTIAVDFDGSSVSDAEVGSQLTTDLIMGHVEIYAEDDSVGIHLSSDLRDWLRGRLHTSVGVNFPIYDYRQGPTPPVVGYMDIDGVSAFRNTTVSDDVWVRHWFRVRCEIRDTYSSASPETLPSLPPGTYPSPGLAPSASLFPAS